MPYTDFDLSTAIARFELRTTSGSVFPPLKPVVVPDWLTDQLARGTHVKIGSEKARNEFIVAPIMLAVRELSGNSVTIFSGERFDVDPVAGLTGESDFLLTLSPLIPIICAPVMFIVEAKKQDVDGGLGQCAAQMVAARRFDLRHGRARVTVYGCVTTGEDWQFLRLNESELIIDPNRLYKSEVGRILAAFLHAVSENKALAAA